MAKMTVYHGGYTPVKHPEIREEETQRFWYRILLYSYKGTGSKVGEKI